MIDFAFVVVSYNQEKYVRQHLQSIKYQIENFGSNKKIQIVFSDDSSKDNTVEIAQNWLNTNKNLFDQIDIITHEQNVGTIRNMRDAIYKTNAKNYKMLACDDLYFKNNIFEIQDRADIILTPTISFWDNGEIEKFITPDYCQILRLKKSNIIDGIRNKLKYNQCIPSPGVFMNIKFWKDQQFIDYIMNFKYIEDIPEWDFIFNRKVKFNYTVEALSKPFILYRRGTGISNSIKHEKLNPIDAEYARIRKTIPATEDITPKYLNFYRYAHFWKTHFVNKIWLKKNERNGILEEWNIGIEEVRNFLNYIMSEE